MSLSPSRVIREAGDIDYYMRKIRKLQEDLQLLEDEFSNTKIRLRRAEDFELKYEVATKQVLKFSIDNDSLHAEIRQLKVVIDNLRNDLQKMSSLSPRKQREIKQEEQRQQANKSVIRNLDVEGQTNLDIKRYRSQIESWKDKCQRLQKQSQEKISFLKQQFQTANIKTHERLTRDQDHKFQQLKQELSKYKRLYEEKANMDDFIREKIQRIKVQKDKQISRLNKIIENQYSQMQIKGEQNTAQILAVKDKYTSMLNMELQKIHKAMDDQDQIFDIQIRGFKKLVELKDTQIQEMLRLMKSNSEKHMRQREQLKNQINKLRQALYNSQRQNENELYNMKQRLSCINAQAIQKLNSQYENNKNSLEEQIINLKQLLEKKQEEYRNQVKQKDRICQNLQAKVDQKDNKINELLQRISFSGGQNVNEVKEISHSLHKIKEEKQQVFAGLSDNIAFKNNQINKLTSTIQLKNIEIKNLYEDVALLKKQMGQVQKELEAKWRQQRKDREAERDSLRQQNQNMESQWKTKEREWKLKQKSFLNDKERLDRENLKLKLSRDQIEKVNGELTNQVKEIDNLYKKELKKNYMGSLDTSSLRRELMHQIQKQQIDLQLSKKQQVEDIKKKHEVEMDRLRFQLSNLQSQLNSRNNDVQKLNIEFKKLDSSADKVLKGKFQEYQLKLAALNSEIYLTQNMYNSLMEAKSRVKKEAV